MPIVESNKVELAPVEIEGVHRVSKANVISKAQGWDSHTLRVFRLEGGGYTPRHQHPWEHVNYVISGKGTLRLGDTVHDIGPGDFACVPPNTDHQFENPNREPFEFICIVPNSARY